MMNITHIIDSESMNKYVKGIDCKNVIVYLERNDKTDIFFKDAESFHKVMYIYSTIVLYSHEKYDSDKVIDILSNIECKMCEKEHHHMFTCRVCFYYLCDACFNKVYKNNKLCPRCKQSTLS